VQLPAQAALPSRSARPADQASDWAGYAPDHSAAPPTSVSSSRWTPPLAVA